MLLKITDEFFIDPDEILFFSDHYDGFYITFKNKEILDIDNIKAKIFLEKLNEHLDVK